MACEVFASFVNDLPEKVQVLAIGYRHQLTASKAFALGPCPAACSTLLSCDQEVLMKLKAQSTCGTACKVCQHARVANGDGAGKLVLIGSSLTPKLQPIYAGQGALATYVLISGLAAMRSSIASKLVLYLSVADDVLKLILRLIILTIDPSTWIIPHELACSQISATSSAIEPSDD